MSTLLVRIRRTWERVRTEPGLWRNVAVLAIVIVLAAVTGGYILSQQRIEWPWQSRFEFQALFHDAPGISPGNGQEVRIAGAKVGTIDDAGVGNNGDARLTFDIDAKYRVYDNATVVLRPKSPLNEMYVELNPGGPPGKPLSNGATLPMGNSQRPIQVDEALGHLDGNTRQALTTLLSESDAALASAPQNLPGGLTATDQVARHLQPVVQALQTRRDTLQKLVSALSQISNAVGGDGQRLGDLANSLDTTLNSLGQHSGDLKSVVAQLPAFTQQLKQATTAVQSLSGQLDPALDNLKNASGTLPGSLNKLTNTADQVGKTVDVGSPVLERAQPVVRDLRPFVGDLNSALPDVKASTGHLDKVTGMLVPGLKDLGPFMINTRSLTSFQDGNGGILRGFLEVNPSEVPGKPLQPLSTPTQPYRFPQ